LRDIAFIPGLTLSKGFFDEHVHPLVEDRFSGVPFSAAMIGPGSEILGVDTPMSTDHHWGPRVMLFLRPEDYDRHAANIRAHLARHLPPTYRGYSTHFSPPDDNGVQQPIAHEQGPINHRVDLFTIDAFFRSYLGRSPFEAMTPAHWLSLPTQKLRSIVEGAVFHDDLGLTVVRNGFSWYPRDVSFYVLACLWTRIGEEEHLMGRAGLVGDEIGSALIGARLARDIMRIAFYLERQYPPYPKWFGTAFVRLDCAAALLPHVEAALHARAWQERERALNHAYEALDDIQRAKGIGDGSVRRASRFHGRPFMVIHGDVIADAIVSQIADAELARLATARRVGSIDLISDNTKVLEDAVLATLVHDWYAA
jgi:hypothetical protein